MKTTHLIRIAALSALVFTGVAQAGPTELIVNGGFETTLNGAVSGYRAVGNGSGDIVGWTVGNTSVDLIHGAYGAISGNSVDMLGTPGPGSLSQSFATLAGHNYVLNFDLSRNPGDSSNLGVSFNGGAQTVFVGTSTITHYSLNYTAASSSTLLTFTSGASGYSGAVLDNVSVTAVPEPETYGMMLAGLGLLVALRKAKRRSA